MPTNQQYELVKKQVESFRSIGCATTFEMKNMAFETAPKILITHWFSVKTYRFSDPDWDVISMQLSTLYKNLKAKVNQ